MKKFYKAISLLILSSILFSYFTVFAHAETIGNALITENFDNGVSAWTASDSSACSIYSDSGNNTYKMTGGISYAGDTSWTNYQVSARVKPITANTYYSAGVIVRYTDINNFILVRLSGNTSSNRTYELYKWENGTASKIASFQKDFPMNEWYTINAQVLDNRITVKINDELIFDGTDIGQNFPKGAVGLRTYAGSALFDDVEVKEILSDPADTAIYTTKSSAYSENGSNWSDTSLKDYDGSSTIRKSNTKDSMAVYQEYAHNLAQGTVGNYFVYAWIPEGVVGSGIVSYNIKTANGTWSKGIKQSENAGKWLLLAIVSATGDTAINFEIVATDTLGAYAGSVKLVKTNVTADPVGSVTGGIDTQTIVVMANQVGYDIDGIKRATVTNVVDNTEFTLKNAVTNEVAFTGKVVGGIADFSEFNPTIRTEYYIECSGIKSVGFSIAKNLYQRVSTPVAMSFMNHARNDVWLPGKTSLAWRDSHQFSFEIPSLVMQYMSNPSLYENMKYGIYNLNQTQFANLTVQNEPDIIWLMKYGMEWYYKNNKVTGQNLHPLIKEQLAYFLYVYPYIKEYVTEADYIKYRDWAIEIWGNSATDNMLKYYSVSDEKSNLFEIQTAVGGIKGAFPPGHSIVPNLLMYEVVKRDGLTGADNYFKAAYDNCDYILKNWDITDPKYSKGQRMSEHILMENLAYFCEMYPTTAPTDLKAKINGWADKMIARSENIWDLRMATSIAAGDGVDYWTGSGYAYATGQATSLMNEPGNEIGMQAIAYAAARVVDDADKVKRLKEIGDAGRDNMFGRNPFGRMFFYDAKTEIEGADLGWFGKMSGGNGFLVDVPGRLDGSPKESTYPFDSKADYGYIEGWVAFNTNWNTALAYTAGDGLELTVDKTQASGGDKVKIRLKAPVNVDYQNTEKAFVYLTNTQTGLITKVALTEESVDDFYFSTDYTVPDITATYKISYGMGNFEVAQNLTVMGGVYIPITNIELNKTELSILQQESETLTATTVPQNATHNQVLWSSSNSAIASVSQDGIVTANSVGTATISATGIVEKDIVASCVVNVTQKQSSIPEFTGFKSVDLNFDDVTVPSNLWGFTANGTGFSVASATDKLDSTNKVLQFKGGNTTSTQGYSEFNIPFSDVGKSYQVSFDLYHPLMAAGESFIRLTDSSKNDIFSLYMRESASSTNIVGKTMRYGLNTKMGSTGSLSTGVTGSAKLTTTAQTGNVGANGILYHVYSSMDFETKKQTLIIENKQTKEIVFSIENADITTAQGLSKMFVGYGYNTSTYEGVYLDNFVVTTKSDKDIAIQNFTSLKGNVNATIANLSGVDKDVYALLATYNENGSLVDIKAQKTTISGKTNENSYQLTDTVTFDENSNLVKLFVWEGLNTMKPYVTSQETIDPKDALNLFAMVDPVPLKNQLIDAGYYTWCGSYIKGDDGKYHVFYARWKLEYGFVPGWVSHSEIAHAVSDNIDGPYVFSDLVLAPRDRSFWDGTTSHNPYILKIGDKYCLYYMGTTAPEGTVETPTSYSAEWYKYRNRQQIGVAISDSPYGPWTRYDQPVLGPDTTPNEDGTTKWDSMLVSNPALTVTPEGKVLMIYKAVKDTTGGDKSAKNGVVKIGLAICDTPDGQFAKTGGLIFESSTSSTLAAEDPYLWYSQKDKKYYTVIREADGSYTGLAGALILFESKDGITDWKPSPFPLVLKPNFLWEDGKSSVSRVERPWLMFDDNETPIMLFGATRLDTGEKNTTNVFIPLSAK